MPGFLMEGLDNPRKGLGPVPSYLEQPVVSITKDEDSEEENKEEKNPTDMNNKDQVRDVWS